MPKGSPGKQHYKWGQGLGVHESGYIKVRVGRGHPVADTNGWAYLHRVIWEAAGRRVPAGHILHHVNGDKTDNRIKNLEVVSRAEHNRHHNKEKGFDPATGRFIRKKDAGRLLDGREWSQFPKEAQR